MKYIIWKRPNNDMYHKLVKGYYTSYHIGYKNQYEHEVIYIINLNSYKRKRRINIKILLRRFLMYLYNKI